MSTKPILFLHFDGVIHSHTSGWRGATIITDPPVPGAMEFIAAAVEHFWVDVFSSRSSEPFGRDAMSRYICDHLEKTVGPHKASIIISLIHFPTEKPPAFISIDDRAITFQGVWPEIATLLAFKPWNKR